MSADACACGWKLPTFEMPTDGTIVVFRCGNCGERIIETCGKPIVEHVGEQVARNTRARALVMCAHPPELRLDYVEDGRIVDLWWCRACGVFETNGHKRHTPATLATLAAFVAEAGQ